MKESFLAIVVGVLNKSKIKKLRDKTVIVTGGTAGIGKALAKILQKKGIKVIITGRDEMKLKNATEELNSQKKENDHEIKYVKLDMNEDFAETTIEDAFRGVDLSELRGLFNNAGVSSEFPKLLVEENRIDEILKVNNLSLVKLTRFFLMKMRNVKEKNFIINIGSFTSELPSAFLSVYAASKSFLKTFSISLASECAPLNTHVEYIETAFVSTKMSKEKESFHVPSPDNFAFSIINTFGTRTVNPSFFIHNLMFIVLSIIPDIIKRKVVFIVNSGVRAAGLRKKAKQKKE